MKFGDTLRLLREADREAAMAIHEARGTQREIQILLYRAIQEPEIKAIRSLVTGRLKLNPIAWNDGYGHMIANNDRAFMFKRGLATPVVTGKFCDLWEPGFQQLFGIREREWKTKFTKPERRQLEAKLRARAWGAKSRRAFEMSWLNDYAPSAFSDLMAAKPKGEDWDHQAAHEAFTKRIMKN